MIGGLFAEPTSAADAFKHHYKEIMKIRDRTLFNAVHKRFWDILLKGAAEIVLFGGSNNTFTDILKRTTESDCFDLFKIVACAVPEIIVSVALLMPDRRHTIDQVLIKTIKRIFFRVLFSNSLSGLFSPQFIISNVRIIEIYAEMLIDDVSY